MATLAKAPVEVLEDAWNRLDVRPTYRVLRSPETGLVMVRARAGSTGMQFHVGEVAVTRCTVQVEGGAAGTAYILGRNPRHAERAALFDALLQDSRWHAFLMKTLIQPIAASVQERKNKIARKVAATKVEFFTMVRGED
jgi:alpha-D-ribose 1-methylphosphonate 5-triphosphate synthase subunit PhnG